MVSQAVAAGGTTPNPAKDHGFMYAHGFQDPDGHIWELIYMEPAAAAA
jgi:predicted lactoylglutathione lyase